MMKKKCLSSILLLLVLLLIFGCENQTNSLSEETLEVQESDVLTEEEESIKPVEESEEIVKEKPEIELDPTPIKEVLRPIVQYDSNLVAYFTFDENADDIVSNFKGTMKGGEIRPGKVGNALYLDGEGDYVELSEEALNSMGTLKQGTIAFWLNFNSILNKQAVMPIFYTGILDKPTSKDNMFIIEIGHAAGTEDFSQDRRYPPGTPDPENKRIYATWIKDGQEPFLCSDSEVDIVENQWQHFAVVSGEDGNTLYLNGEEVRNRDYNFGHSTDKAFFNDIPVKEIMTIGYGRSHTWISPEFVYYKGLLDDFRVYDKPLTAEEIRNLYSKS
jgi:hypothetical protein